MFYIYERHIIVMSGILLHKLIEEREKVDF